MKDQVPVCFNKKLISMFGVAVLPQMLPKSDLNSEPLANLLRLG